MKQYKTVLLMATLLLIAFFSKAQVQKTVFEFTLYAQDIRGNKDSIIIGYHPDAQSVTRIDPLFGDLHIDRKFDSIFEIRGHKMGYVHNKSWRLEKTQEQNIERAYEIRNAGISERITLRYTNRGEAICTPRGIGGPGFILVKSKYPPVKFYWNKPLFDRVKAPCVGKTYIVPNEIYLQESPPEDPIWNGATVYFSDQDAFSSSLMRNLGPATPQRFLVPYLDGTHDTLYNFVFMFENSQARITSTEEAIEHISTIYPNPCVDILNVQLPILPSFQGQVNIYDASGRLSRSEKKWIDSENLNIKVADLNTGFYFLDIIHSDGKHFSAKFLKE